MRILLKTFENRKKTERKDCKIVMVDRHIYLYNPMPELEKAVDRITVYTDRHLKYPDGFYRQAGNLYYGSASKLETWANDPYAIIAFQKLGIITCKELSVLIKEHKEKEKKKYLKDRAVQLKGIANRVGMKLTKTQIKFLKKIEEEI